MRSSAKIHSHAPSSYQEAITNALVLCFIPTYLQDILLSILGYSFYKLARLVYVSKEPFAKTSKDFTSDEETRTRTQDLMIEKPRVYH